MRCAAGRSVRRVRRHQRHADLPAGGKGPGVLRRARRAARNRAWVRGVFAQVTGLLSWRAREPAVGRVVAPVTQP